MFIAKRDRLKTGSAFFITVARCLRNTGETGNTGKQDVKK